MSENSLEDETLVDVQDSLEDETPAEVRDSLENEEAENPVNIANIVDKKDFAEHLQEEKPFVEPFFKEEVVLFDRYLNAYDENEADESILLEIINENKKGLIILPDSYFHYFPDFIGSIYVFLNNCIKNNIEKVEIVVLNIDGDQTVVNNFGDFFDHFLSLFSEKIEIIHTPIKKRFENNLPVFKINNSNVMDQQDIGISLDFLYQASKSFSESSENVVPNKKIFLSRLRDSFRDSANNRDANAEEVESFFQSLGFEIINAESFGSLKEQMSFFNDVSVLVGYTGAGMTSSMFMQPGQTVVEIVCPLKFEDGDKYEIHNFYKTMSLLKKHTYIGVANINSSKEDILGQLANVAKML
jgi:hypothetical protein